MTQRYANDNKPIFHHTLYGDVIGAGAVQCLFSMDNQAVNPFAWCPGLPTAAKLRRAMVTSQCAADTTPGNWTLHVRANEDLATDVATLSIAVGTAIGKTAGNVSPQPHFQAGDTYWIIADGPSKDTVILRVVLEFEWL